MHITLDTLPEPVARYIEEQLKFGEYSSPEELVTSVLAREASRATVPPPRRKVTMGMFDHLGMLADAEDIRKTRRDGWANFPSDLS